MVLVPVLSVPVLLPASFSARSSTDNQSQCCHTVRHATSPCHQAVSHANRQGTHTQGEREREKAQAHKGRQQEREERKWGMLGTRERWRGVGWGKREKRGW